MTVKPGETAYYLDDFADEVLPEGLEDVTLEGWAKWLAKGGSGKYGWTFAPPGDGETFAGSSLTFLDDVTVRRCALSPECDFDNDEFEFSPELPPNRDFAAVRFGPGLGWDSDCILDPDDLGDGLKDIMDVGDDAILAVARSKTHRFRYRADPPRLEIVE